MWSFGKERPASEIVLTERQYEVLTQAEFDLSMHQVWSDESLVDQLKSVLPSEYTTEVIEAYLRGVS